MSPVSEPAELGILLYPRAQLAAVHGLTDLFLVANRLAAQGEGADPPVLRVSHWQAMEDGAIERDFDTHPERASRPRALILPPSLGEPITPEAAAAPARWLKARHAEGAMLCSVCAGAFLLAETGLLAGRTVTTHWNLTERLAARFPDVRVDADKLVIDDGDVMTAGGLMAWTDLGLKLVDRLLGPTMMLKTARFLLVDPPGREQRYYSSFAPRLQHGDEAILRTQHWLQATGARDVSLAAMASRAGLEARTFLRRFRKATGLKPTEYCQQLRVGKARELLESTSRTIDQVAWDVGYEDAGAFRKVFHKVMGLTPGDYRGRFGQLPRSRRPA
jgi:transcriptional regulator GlxA family with amidase domain